MVDEERQLTIVEQFENGSIRKIRYQGERNQGLIVKQQVYCTNGRADIVTSEAIYEVKAFLTRNNIYKAIGQLFSYQRSINPTANVFIIGCKPRNQSEQEIDASLATSPGIEVIVWDWDSLELSDFSGKL